MLAKQAGGGFQILYLQGRRYQNPVRTGVFPVRFKTRRGRSFQSRGFCEREGLVPLSLDLVLGVMRGSLSADQRVKGRF